MKIITNYNIFLKSKYSKYITIYFKYKFILFLDYIFYIYCFYTFIYL